MPATTISSVWEHFEVFDDKSFTCRVDNCDLHFNPPLRSTTAMRHLGRKHSEIYDQVVKKEVERKGGMKEEEENADESEPVTKKNRSTTNANGKAIPGMALPAKVAAVEEKQKDVPHTAMPKATPNGKDSAPKHIQNAATSAKGSVVKEKRTVSLHEAMPSEAPTSSKETAAKCTKAVCEALPEIAQEGDKPETKVRRKAAVEAEKRIGHLNDWLYRVRKEQKEVRAKRTAVREDANVEQEDSDIRYPVDLILDERWIDGKRQLRLRWAGYDASADTWEPVDHLTGAAELLAAFDAEMDDGFEEMMNDE